VVIYIATATSIAVAILTISVSASISIAVAIFLRDQRGNVVLLRHNCRRCQQQRRKQPAICLSENCSHLIRS
jgi:hypothetical protein